MLRLMWDHVPPCRKANTFLSLRVTLGSSSILRRGDRECGGGPGPGHGGRFSPTSSSLPRKEAHTSLGPQDFQGSQKRRGKHVLHFMWDTVLIKLVSFFSY